MSFYTFGPQSQNVTTQRPATDPRASFYDTWFHDCSGNLLDGTQMTPSWANVVTAQLNSACRHAGVNPDPANDAALWQAMSAARAYVLPQANHVARGGVKLATDVLVTAGADDTTTVTSAQAKSKLLANGCTQPPYAGYDEIGVARNAVITIDLSTYLARSPASVTLVRPPTAGFSLAGYVVAYTAPSTAGIDKIGFVATNAYGQSNVGFINLTIS